MLPAPLLVGLLLLSTSVGGSAQETPSAPADVFKFAWPSPSSAMVVKDGEKKGEKAKLRFRLDVAAEESGGLRARLTEFWFLEVAGRDASTPAMKAALAPALAMAQAVPDTLVDAKGNYLGIDGIDALVERVVKFRAEQRGDSEQQRELLLKQLRSPVMQESLRQACAADWNTWVGSWIGFDVAPRSETSAAGEMPLMGVSIPATATRRHHGPVPEHPGYVRLSAMTLAEGPEATAAFARAMQRVAEQSGGEAFPSDRLEEVRQELHLEVVTDPRTLRPLRASRTKIARVKMKGEALREQVERAAYTFDWQQSAVQR